MFISETMVHTLTNMVKVCLITEKDVVFHVNIFLMASLVCKSTSSLGIFLHNCHNRYIDLFISCILKHLTAVVFRQGCSGDVSNLRWQI